MFDKVSQVAEQVATKASRREFLGGLGRAAAGAAGLLGGILAFPAGAPAQDAGVVCCTYKCSKSRLCEGGFFSRCQAAGTLCGPPNLSGCSCKLQHQQDKANCDDC